MNLSVKHIGNLTNWYGDSDRVEQILTNLIDNAIRYTHQNDSINVVFDDTDEEDFVITVQDSGVGIAKEHLDQIFDRFIKLTLLAREVNTEQDLVSLSSKNYRCTSWND